VTVAKILIVEDNPTNLELVTDLLEPLGYVILPAETAEEGIHLATLELPDLILMDVALPGMDGLSATQQLKGDPRTQRIPIVALTAHAMSGDERRVLAAGCAGYITKPIDTRSFPATVTRFL
jgi:CheY-like chemotaxis protein